MSAKYWLEVKDGIAYNKVWSPDGIADMQEHWVELPEEDIAQVGWSWDGTTWTEPTVSIDELRVDRDALLRASDFTQLADSPFTNDERAALVLYRQELRDLPSSYTPVAQPVFPVDPTQSDNPEE
jgi:hypothetical protein